MARVPASQYGMVSVDDLNTIEDYIRDLGHVSRNLRFGEALIARVLSHVQLGFAQSLSGGPVDPQQTNPGAAWKIPVRRISEDYYRGWKVKRVAPGWWQVYNNSREAYFIEFGINPRASVGTPVRRPIRKISLIRTLRFADQSRIGHRVWWQVFSPLNQQGALGTVSRSGMRYLGMRYTPRTGTRLFGVGG